MIVCHCKVVTSREIDRAIADGAECIDDVADACGAGGGCGACRGFIDEMIDRATCAHRAASSFASIDCSRTRRRITSPANPGKSKEAA